jgi:hypothetical protein
MNARDEKVSRRNKRDRAGTGEGRGERLGFGSFINASLSTHVKNQKPKCEQQTNNTHTHTHTRQTDKPATRKMMMMLPRRLSATKVLVSMLAFSVCLSQTARVSLASTITPFQDVEGGLAGVGQDLVNEFGGGIQVDSQFDGPVDQGLQGLLEGSVSEEDFLDSSAGRRNLQADFGDAANVAKDILKITTGIKTIGQDVADAPKYGRRNL